jgi:AcrR family transcriptional regulator
VTPLTPIAPTTEGTRPRVEGDREQEIFDATLQVLEEVGYDRLTMDAVASAARASKATLYRRWNGKVALVIDALISQKGQPAVPDTGTLRGDLPDDATIERVVDHVILPAVRHPSCVQGSNEQSNHKLTKDKARKTT